VERESDSLIYIVLTAADSFAEMFKKLWRATTEEQQVDVIWLFFFVVKAFVTKSN
jgi:hypothetical protein